MRGREPQRMASPTPEALGAGSRPRELTLPCSSSSLTPPPGDTRGQALLLQDSGFQLRDATPTPHPCLDSSQTEADPGSGRPGTPWQPALPRSAGHLGSTQGGLQAPGANTQEPVGTQGWPARVAPLPAR